MSHATGAQPATQPAVNPLSVSKPWNLVADGYAEFWDNIVKGSVPIQMMKKSIMSVRGEISVHGEPVEPHSDSTSEELWREKEKLALTWLNFMAHRSSISMNKSGAIWNGSRRIMFRFSNQEFNVLRSQSVTSSSEAWLGGGRKMMTTKNRDLPPIAHSLSAPAYFK